MFLGNVAVKINVLYLEGDIDVTSVIDICLIMTMLPRQHINTGAHIFLFYSDVVMLFGIDWK